MFICLISPFTFAAPDSQLLKQLDLQRALHPDQYKSMESEGKQVFYIEQQNTTAITKGVAILIPDTGISIASQQGLAPLARELNKLGWVTILLMAPNSAFTPPALIETTTEAVDNTDNNESVTTATPTSENTTPPPKEIHNKAAEAAIDPNHFEQHQQDLVALLEAGIKKVGEYPGYYLVISQGTSAAWLTKIFAEFKSSIPDAFVAIGPFWPDRNYNQQLAKLMAKTPMPLLDIYDKRNNDWALNTVQQREIKAVSSLKMMYRQRQLLGSNLPEQHSYHLSKEIHGWLTQMGW